MRQHAPTHHAFPGQSRDGAFDGSFDWARDRPRGRDWLASVFHCRAAQTGGIIRRQIVDVEREIGRRTFEAEVRRRGFRLVRTRHHYVVVCDPGPVDVVF